jgi:hypothetical protein
MTDAPIRYMDGAALNSFSNRDGQYTSAYAQARTRQVEQEIIDAGLLHPSPPTLAIHKDHRDSTISLASKVAEKVKDQEERLRLRLEAIRMHVGAKITERYVCSFHQPLARFTECISLRQSHGKPYFAETLDSIKFGFKGLWAINRLKTFG